MTSRSSAVNVKASPSLPVSATSTWLLSLYCHVRSIFMCRITAKLHTSPPLPPLSYLHSRHESSRFACEDLSLLWECEAHLGAFENHRQDSKEDCGCQAFHTWILSSTQLRSADCNQSAECFKRKSVAVSDGFSCKVNLHRHMVGHLGPSPIVHPGLISKVGD